METIIIAIISAMMGSFITVLLLKNSGTFIPRDEFDDFITKMAQEFSEVDKHIDDALYSNKAILTSVDTTIDEVDKVLAKVRNEWENHKQWTLGAWNDMYHLRDEITKENNQ